MKLKRILLLVVIVPVLIILALIGKNYAVDTYRDWKYAPTINPQPKYFMTVKGNVDPKLIGKIDIGMQAIYSTTVKNCDKTYNALEGVRGWRQKEIMFYPENIEKNGNYKIEIPLDYFTSGVCSWMIAAIRDYSGAPEEIGNGLVIFSPCGSSSTCQIYNADNIENEKYALQSTRNNYCYYKNNKLSCTLGYSSDFNSTALIPRKNNYLLVENFYFKEVLHD
jgi:hypothetical protein